MDLKGQGSTGDLKSRWSWQVAGFEPRTSFDGEEDEMKSHMLRTPALTRRYSISTMAPRSELSRHNIHAKLHQVDDHLQATREDIFEIRQEASDMQEYCHVKLGRVMRYMGVLAEKARKLDLIALETEARITPLVIERKKLFNDLLTLRGNVRVFCRVRPQFEDEGFPATEFPDDFTIRINPGDDLVTSKKDFEFDRVYGPHVGQGDFFQDIQPFVQSALDGYNVSIFAYGQTGSGKTYTMEGSSHDRGIYIRVFEELFDLSNADITTCSKFYFHVTIFEFHNEQVHDLLLISSGNLSRIHMGMAGFSVELVQEKIENPTDFSRVLKLGLQNRGNHNSNTAQRRHSHLVVTIHIHCSSSLAEQSHYSKISLVDLAGSEPLRKEGASGKDLSELLHVNKSLSALGDVVSALTGKKDHVPYGNSRLTQILSDSLGGYSKTLLIVNVSPGYEDVRETISSLNFAARARTVELSLGNRDTIKKWRDMANESRKEMYEKEKEVADAREEIMSLKKQLKEADEQSLLLFSEVQKAWKVAFALQADLKTESLMLQDQQKVEKEQNAQLRNQVSKLMKVEQEQKIHMVESTTLIQTLEAKVKELEHKLSDVQAIKGMNKADTDLGRGSIKFNNSQILNIGEKSATASSITKKLEEELAKRDKLIERLHEENEKLFERLTEKSAPGGSQKVTSTDSRGFDDLHLDGSIRNGSFRSKSPHQRSLSSGGTLALVKSGFQKIKTTPAGEYLTSALMDFNPDQYESLASVADGANKLLMLVLAAVIKAGAAREHEMLAEIRDAVFSFIYKMEARRVMDTMLVSRVRILYIRSLLSRSSELQTIKVLPVERFLEKSSTGRSRNSSRGSSPGRSPGHYFHNSSSDLIDGHIRAFKVNIKQEKKSKFSSIVLKLRGIDQETWRHHVTGGKLREITEEGRNFATGNKALAVLFVHTPAGELQRQIRAWLAENFDFLSVTGGDGVGGVAGQLELLSTAIMDGWMAGLGTPQHPSTDSLGQLLSDYTKRVYTSQLQHLKDIAGTLATEEADDLPSITKLRSALESVEHKRRKILQQVRTDIALLTKEQGGSPVRNPSTAAEDARLASLISLEDILRQVEDINREASQKAITGTKKKAMLEALDELSGRMPSLLSIDHPCAQRHIAEAHKIIECIEVINENLLLSIQSAENEVVQWSVLQFNTGSTAPFVIKCGATSNTELVVKAKAKMQDENSHEIVAIVPKPSMLTNLSLEEMRQMLSQLPEALCQLALARTADGTRARYSRLYKTLAMKVPSMKNTINEFEQDEPSRDVMNPCTPSNRSAQFRRKTESDSLSEATQ